MRLHLVTVGSPKLEYARLGCELYATRLTRFHKLRVTRVKDSKRSGVSAMLEEGQAMLEAIGNAYLIALDPRGKSLDTPALYDAATGLGACGDWCAGPRVEGAFLSGRRAAASVLRSLG